MERDDESIEQTIQAVMAELGVSREAASVLAAVRNGDAMVGDVIFEYSADRVATRPVGAGAACGPDATKGQDRKDSDPA